MAVGIMFYDDGVDNAILFDSEGKIVFGDTDCVCCGAPPNCCHCGDCCYSDQSRVRMVWTFDDPPELTTTWAGWPNTVAGWNDYFKSGDETLPYLSCNVYGSPYGKWAEPWLGDGDPPARARVVAGTPYYAPYGYHAGEIWAQRSCTTGAWTAMTNEISHYLQDVQFTGGSGGCCGATGTTGVYLGAALTGTWSITVENNRCCHEADADECHVTSADNCPDDDDCDDLVLP